jgi:hypothetical protein
MPGRKQKNKQKQKNVERRDVVGATYPNEPTPASREPVANIPNNTPTRDPPTQRSTVPEVRTQPSGTSRATPGANTVVATPVRATAGPSAAPARR